MLSRLKKFLESSLDDLIDASLDDTTTSGNVGTIDVAMTHDDDEEEEDIGD